MKTSPRVADSSRWASGCSDERGRHDFDVLVLRQWPLTPTEGHLWHAMGWVHTAGHAGVKLSPPWLYYLGAFGEGAPTWLSQRVQSLVCDRQGAAAPRRLSFWTLKIKALRVAADECRHVAHCKVVEIICKLSSHKKSVYQVCQRIFYIRIVKKKQISEYMSNIWYLKVNIACYHPTFASTDNT